MNTKTFKVIVIFLGLVSAGSALAETPLKLGADLARIHGTARASAVISAIVFYTPLYKFDKKVSSQGCTFTEDRWKPNENDVSVTVKAQLQVGGYELKVPTQGVRGSCVYVLESFYLSIEDKPVSETLNILSERQIQRLSAELSDIGGLDPVKNLSEIKALYCEFKTDFENGFCYPAQDTLSTYYGVSNLSATYTLDLKDISERPERQY
jgi:hypothetical protein